MSKKYAFSLIELSVVILIIALIIGGVTQSSKLIKKSRLATAQSLTQNSIVNNLDNIVAWYETSLDSSFLSDELNDGNLISTWLDNNPKAINKNNALQSTNIYKPQYLENIFNNNSIPALRFNSSTMAFDGTTLANNSYTIFVVEQRRSNISKNYFIGGKTLNMNQNLILGYRFNTTITQAHYGNDMDVGVNSYTTPIPQIHTFVFDSTRGKSYWLNSALISNNAAQTAALTSFNQAAIGEFNGSLFIGDLAEIIIFKSKLKNEDQKAVEIYLSKKYGINIS